MIDSLVFYRECLTRAYFLGKESPDASERSLRFHSEVDLWNVSRTMTGGRRKLDSYVSLRSWRFFFSFWGRGGGGNLSSSLWGASDGAGARALASHQCGRVQIPASTPYMGMWVEFVVGFLPRSERFFSGHSVFPSPQKSTFPNSNSTRNQVDEEPLCGCVTSKSLFIYLFIY